MYIASPPTLVSRSPLAAQASVDDSPVRPVSKEKQAPFLRISHYEYQGRESEGNRFIHNSDL